MTWLSHYRWVSSTYMLCDCPIRVMWLPHTCHVTAPYAIICNLSPFICAMGRANAGFWLQGSECGICDGKSGVDRFSLSLSHACTNTHSHTLSLSLVFNTYYFINYWFRLILYTQLTQCTVFSTAKWLHERATILSYKYIILFTINKGIMI
jgi:hypothetical protein